MEEHKFWKFDSELGWRGTENASGTFTNGYFKALVNLDSHGNRMNSPSGTFKEEFTNVFMIGDSTTASHEVNDDETIPANLERLWREEGRSINVINLGVRGYGTDQAVKRALNLMDEYNPSTILYHFTSNDLDDNNTIKRIGRVYGKNVFIREGAGGAFVERFRAVPQWERSHFAYVDFDETCRPFIHEGDSYFREHLFSGKLRDLAEYSITLRKLSSLVYNHWLQMELQRMDRQAETSIRCSAYYFAQIRFLIEQLRVKSVKRIFVSGFFPPHIASIFETFTKEHLIDGFVDLSSPLIASNTNFADFRCPNDFHFCAGGNKWVAGILHQQFIPVITPSRATKKSVMKGK